MRELIDKLNKASDAYYNGTPIMSDKEWDKLFDTLVQKERETGIIMANSPTQNVGYEVRSNLLKVTHIYPMMSLDKTKSLVDLQSFSPNKPCYLSLKMDGLTVRLTYDDGMLIRGETRGNGDVGEDVTHNVKTMKNVPIGIKYKGTLIVDGECIITYDDFERIKGDYKNPRNLASGSIRQLDSKIAAKRELRFIAWRVVEGVDSNSNEERLSYIAKEFGFDVVPYLRFPDSNVITSDNLEYLRLFAEKKGYPIDGLVLGIDDVKYGNSLGATGHHPKHSVAFKYEEESETTILRDIEWSMGKTGDLTPVAVFDPVELCGTEVSRASLHNISIMSNLYRGTWYEGLRLTIIKANEIIPQILSVEDGERIDGKHFYIPAFCPICGGLTRIREDNSSKVLCCDNPDCSGKKLGKFVQFCSKDAMDIKGLSEATLKALLDGGHISTYKDLYSLHYLKTRLSMIPGMGAKSVDNLIKAIEKSRHTTLNRFLVALSIPNIGRSASKAIMNHCNGTEDFFWKWSDGYDWTQLPDFGEVMSNSLNQFYRDYCYMIEDVRGMLEIECPKANKGSSLNGKTFVVTGSLNHYKNRDELKAKIEELGGKVSGSVSKKTDYLINNDISSTTGKNKKAKELGVSIITEDEFIKMII